MSLRDDLIAAKARRSRGAVVDLAYMFGMSQPEPNTGCWLWTGTVDQYGYGQLRINGKVERAHRLAYKLAGGGNDIPRGLVVCHRCDQPGCINPAHLFAGTQKENISDCIAKGRFPSGELHKNSKITADLARTLRDDPRSAAATGRAFGIGRETVRDIRLGRLWRTA